MDDTAGGLDSVEDLSLFFPALLRATLTSNDFSSELKQLGVVDTSTLHDGQLRQPVALMGNTPIKMHHGFGYIRVLRRHTMLHFY